MSYVKGSDVSDYQDGSYPTKGLGFAFVKATQGVSYTNKDMPAQIATAEKAKLVVGVYHFMQPGDSVSAQVAYFKSRGVVKPGYLIAVDWEGLNGAWPSNADKDALIKGLKAAYPKNRVGLYTNRDGWLTHDHTSYCGDFLWIADITTAGKPRIQHDWTFHQYGEVGKIDADVANFQDQTSLKNWAGIPSATTPTPTARTAEYTALMMNDVFPTSGDHITLQEFFTELSVTVHENNDMLKQIIDHINTPAPSAADIEAVTKNEE